MEKLRDILNSFNENVLVEVITSNNAVSDGAYTIKEWKEDENKRKYLDMCISNHVELYCGEMDQLIAKDSVLRKEVHLDFDGKTVPCLVVEVCEENFC